MIEIKRLIQKIQNSLTDDLRRAPWKGHSNILTGQCYVASECFYYMTGGPYSSFKPQFMRVNRQPHWFLKGDDLIVDITALQFDHILDYSHAKGKGFLTKNPSKRALQLIQLVMDY